MGWPFWSLSWLSPLTPAAAEEVEPASSVHQRKEVHQREEAAHARDVPPERVPQREEPQRRPEPHVTHQPHHHVMNQNMTTATLHQLTVTKKSHANTKMMTVIHASPST